MIERDAAYLLFSEHNEQGKKSVCLQCMWQQTVLIPFYWCSELKQKPVFMYNCLGDLCFPLQSFEVNFHTENMVATGQEMVREKFLQGQWKVRELHFDLNKS